MTAESPSPSLRILIASTPRTGNTWLKLLLSEIYDLPIVDLPASFDRTLMETLGERWIGHQHYCPVPDLIAWKRQNQLVVITTVRHPADTLVSYVLYLRNRNPIPAAVVRTASMLALDGDELGSHVAHYVETEFFSTLDVTIYWILARESLLIRYEEVWADPVGTLTLLTNQIHPVARHRIERAAALCDFDALRQRFDPEGKVFRSGLVGEGYQALSPEILGLFRSNEPYPSQFAILGYTLDPADQLAVSSLRVRPSTNPFNGTKEFDNGVPIPQIVTEIYWKVENCLYRWPQPVRTFGPESFFTWLNGPAETDPLIGSQPQITNLAVCLHRIRVDLQKAFPEPLIRNRAQFALWFMTYAQQEYGLPDEFLGPDRSD